MDFSEKGENAMARAAQSTACTDLDQYDAEAAFAAFGDLPANPDDQDPGIAWEPLSAEEILRLAAAAARPEPANEGAPPKRAFPALGQRVSPRLDAGLLMKGLAGADWAAVLLTAQLAAHWGEGLGLLSIPLAQTLAFLAAAAMLKVGLWLTDSYRPAPAAAHPELALGGLALGAVLALGFAAIAAPNPRQAAALAATLPAAAILMAGAHAAFALWLKRAWTRGAFAETAIVIGATPAAERFIARARQEGSLNVVAIADDRAARAPDSLAGAPVAGSIADLAAWAHLPKIDRIVICVSHAAEARVRDLIAQLRRLPNRVDLVFDFDIDAAQGRKLARVGGMATAIVSGRSTSTTRAFVKRAEDIVLGAALLALAAPLLAVIAVAVKLDSAGPVFFRQRRHGLNNRVITIWKFRTMRADVCGEPTRQVCANDARVTRLGKFLRRTSLDELPQLLNVVAGSMSLVGPRPHAVDMRAADQTLDAIVDDYAHRHRVKPGITGWAQVNGSRGPIESVEAVRRRVALDLDYIAKSSLWLDLWIIARTLPAMLDAKTVR